MIERFMSTSTKRDVAVIAQTIFALQQLSARTGFKSSRAQQKNLMGLTNQELSAVAVQIMALEKESETKLKEVTTIGKDSNVSNEHTTTK